MILPPLVPSPDGHIAGHNNERTEINANTVARDRNILAAGMESIPRLSAISNTVQTLGSNLRLVMTTARRAEAVTKVQMTTGGTAAAATPTLIRAGIYYQENDLSWTLVGSTVSDTALLAAAATLYTKNLSAPVNLVEGRRYALGLLVVTAVAAPTMYGAILTTGLAALAPQMGANITGQANLPATITNAAVIAGANGNLPYIVAN